MREVAHVRRNLTTARAAALLAAATFLYAAESVVLPAFRAALSYISSDSLRGHVSFLASDLLEGRETSTRGGDLAAEYIAAQFRRAALTPGGQDGYFQDGSITPLARGGTQAAPVKVRNVIAVLRGSSVALRDTCVVLSAHYDHLGTHDGAGGDSIFNGANDDASGTAAVLEIAAAMARMRVKPSRSVVFAVFDGEEKGLLGSRYYAGHPVFQVEKTVAALNLEELGRTDDVTGPVLATAYVTGFDYSGVGPILQWAGKLTGVTVTKHTQNSDKFFTGSDNRPLAQMGIPAHTLSVGYVYPDYHKAGDEWQKLDYANMTKVVRAVMLGVLEIANAAKPPQWNAANPRAEVYGKARENASAPK
jgi:hypothetical protein